MCRYLQYKERFFKYGKKILFKASKIDLKVKPRLVSKLILKRYQGMREDSLLEKNPEVVESQPSIYSLNFLFPVLCTETDIRR